MSKQARTSRVPRRLHEALAQAAREDTRPPAPRPYEPPKVTSAMLALAWSVLHGRQDEFEEAARALAQLVLGEKGG